MVDDWRNFKYFESNILKNEKVLRRTFQFRRVRLYIYNFYKF